MANVIGQVSQPQYSPDGRSTSVENLIARLIYEARNQFSSEITFMPTNGIIALNSVNFGPYELYVTRNGEQGSPYIEIEFYRNDKEKLTKNEIEAIRKYVFQVAVRVDEDIEEYCTNWTFLKISDGGKCMRTFIRDESILPDADISLVINKKEFVKELGAQS